MKLSTIFLKIYSTYCKFIKSVRLKKYFYVWKYNNVLSALPGWGREGVVKKSVGSNGLMRLKVKDS